VSDFCLTPMAIEQFSSYIMGRTSHILMRWCPLCTILSYFVGFL